MHKNKEAKTKKKIEVLGYGKYVDMFTPTPVKMNKEAILKDLISCKNCNGRGNTDSMAGASECVVCGGLGQNCNDEDTLDELLDKILELISKEIPLKKSKDINIKDRGKRLAYKQGWNDCRSFFADTLGEG